MITPMQMYWLLKLDDILAISLVIFVLTFVGFVICLVGATSYKGEKYFECEYNKFKTGRNILFWFVLFFGSSVRKLVHCGVVAAIYVVPAIVNNERVQNIGNKTLDVSEDLLKLTEQYLQAVSIDKR